MKLETPIERLRSSAFIVDGVGGVLRDRYRHRHITDTG